MNHRIPAYWSGSTMCSGPHSCGSTSGGDGIFLSVFRPYGSRFLHGDLDRMRVSSTEQGDAVMKEHGYGCPYYRRSSVPLATFTSIKSHLDECRFDALDRYLRHCARRGLHPHPALHTEHARLKKRASFHPRGDGCAGSVARAKDRRPTPL